ncbi:Collagen alpha-1(XXVII) chain A [Frankliniella fusca]|uniref:Collagen alpha-1(XXVII) chain A n=1 Tax=Frankliniella fusca TaxID=407009 RepID=A0AAE1GVQ7_9NEOP|nr:Collagen alpha-1(XXVII) chain A [Frankliniella fusca]
MAKLQVLVFWLDDRKTSIVDISNAPECDREPGKVAKVQWADGSHYPAQVIKVSKCLKTLEQAEVKFLEKFNSLNKGQSQVQGKRQVKKCEQDVVASAVQVANALAEKVQLPPELAAVKIAAAREKRLVNNNIKCAESAADSVAALSENVSSAKRSLEFYSDDEADANASTSPEKLKEVSPVDGTERQTPKRQGVIETSCANCRRLSSYINPSSMEFLKALSQFCDLDTESDIPPPTRNDSTEVWHLKPLPIDSGHKKVELTAGSGLYLKKASKSRAVVSSGGDPEKLTRDIIQELYGDKLRQKGISALGHGKKRMGIGQTDLQNIYSFVCRNSTISARKGKNNVDLPDYTFQAFIRIVNKKLHTASRDRSQDSGFLKTPKSSRKPVAPELNVTRPPSATPSRLTPPAQDTFIDSGFLKTPKPSPKPVAPELNVTRPPSATPSRLTPPAQDTFIEPAASSYPASYPVQTYSSTMYPSYPTPSNYQSQHYNQPSEPYFSGQSCSSTIYSGMPWLSRSDQPHPIGSVLLDTQTILNL